MKRWKTKIVLLVLPLALACLFVLTGCGCGRHQSERLRPDGNEKDKPAGVSISTAICTSRGFTPQQSLDMFAAAGYKYLEIYLERDNLRYDHDWAALAERITALNMKVWALHGQLSGGSASLDEQKRKKAVRDEVARMTTMAVYAPCPYVVHYFPRYNDPNRIHAFRQCIEELMVHAKALRFTLAVETVPYKPKIDERYADSMEVADFVRSFHSDDVRVCIDLNHSNIKEDLAQVAKNCEGIIAHIYVSDNHGLEEEHLPPGEGTINFPKAFKALRKAGYTGPLNIEVACPAERLNVEMLTKMRLWAEKI